MLFLQLLPCSVVAQDCNLPIVINFSNPSTTSIDIQWIDMNTDVISWEIELGETGFVRSFLPTAAGITSKTYRYTALQSGIRYEFYLRTVCETGNSNWNGPYFFNTNISNDEACYLSLPINDNNCPNTNSFLIDIESNEDDTLGVNVFVDAIELILEHSWPPDLMISLASPSGNEITLFQNRGVNTKHLGNPDDSNCEEKLIFTDLACLEIGNDAPPYLGSFKAEDAISKLNDGHSPSQGTWSLNICDRANGDLGILRSVKIILTRELCQLPENFYLSDIDGSYVTVNWTANLNCSDIKLTYGEEGFQPNQAIIDYVDCQKSNFTINNLQPNTSYELFIETQCPSNTIASNCPITFTTACANSTLTSSFDHLNTCIPNCNRRCNVADSIWHNATTNRIDWILFDEATPSKFTGPDSDIGGNGKYIYLESQPEACGISYSSIFESNCLDISDSEINCGLSFYYHMYGNDIDTLRVDVLTGDKDPVTIWSLSGNQGNVWHYQTLDLSQFANTSSIIQFVANSSGGNLGDIGIDQIKLFSSEINQDLFSFFEDNDDDGFGDPEQEIIICQQLVPEGFSTNGMDCNDNDDDINPNAIEIECNLQDENCNGMDDDQSSNNFSVIILQRINESCQGSADGILNILAQGGVPNYTYEWSHGDTGSQIDNLSAGIYNCTVTDQAGCKFLVNDLFIGSDLQINYAIDQIKDPSCKGRTNGLISLIAGGGQAPYHYAWSNGQIGKSIINLDEGKYWASITDDSGCMTVTDTIFLIADPEVIPGIQQTINVSCFGESDGSLLANVLGGQAPYDFVWNTGANGAFIGQLTSGFYDLTVTDSDGCLGIVKDIFLEEPEVITINIDAVEQMRCASSDNASIEISVSGGTPPYAYFWSDNFFGADRFNIGAGLYSLTVTDVKSCRKELNDIEILNPIAIQIELDSLKNVDCSASDNGFIRLDVSGGSPPYLYNWNNGEKENKIDSLASGNYSVTIIDQFECKSILNNIEIKNNDLPIEIDIEVNNEILCFGDSLASITAMALNGIPPFDFNWSIGTKNIVNNSIDSINNLRSGSYQLTITDALGCTGVSDIIEIDGPAAILATSNLINNECYGQSKGSIELDITGGLSPYQISWNNGMSGRIIDQLSNGNYFAQIKDRNECTLTTQNLLISSPDSIEVTGSVFGQLNGALGAIILEVDGGSPPYRYAWAQPIQNITDSFALNLSTGFYEVSISDIYNCSETRRYFIDNTTSVQESQLDQFILYPNPCSEFLIISNLAEIEIKSIGFVDTQAKFRPLDYENKSTHIEVNVNHIIPGVYFLILEDHTGNPSLFKFVKI